MATTAQTMTLLLAVSYKYNILKTTFSNMTAAITRFKTTFRGDFIAVGSAGMVLEISDEFIVKVKLDFMNPLQDHLEMIKDSKESMKRESDIWDVLTKREHWHVYIVLSFLHGPDCNFLQRAQNTLYNRINQSAPVTRRTVFDWMKELISATAWLESLQLAHGDLHPVNILLTSSGHVQLCDFGCTISYGDRIQAATTPFYRLYEDGSFGIAGAHTEQYALGSCLYFIETQMEPPDGDEVFSVALDSTVSGSVIRSCWKG
ncbi:hypothetical protein MMC25_003224 [Agyrium rufum]|nr:hypothetical protein [Agyrium rufum]